MFHKKKQRYKPLYKQFIRLRENVQNRRILRTTINKFKKRKWKGFIRHLENIRNNRKIKKYPYPKRGFRFHGIERYLVSKFPNYFAKNFSNTLKVKKSLSLYYGSLLKRYIKKQVNISLKKSIYSRKNFGNANLFFIKILESRLDTILYRSFFTLSVRSARQLITHGHVYVNKKVVNTNSFIIQKGDLIEINPKYHKLIHKNIKQSIIWPIPPKYLLINFRTFQILLHENIEVTNFSILFPFWVNLNTLLKYYR